MARGKTEAKHADPMNHEKTSGQDSIEKVPSIPDDLLDIDVSDFSSLFVQLDQNSNIPPGTSAPPQQRSIPYIWITFLFAILLLIGIGYFSEQQRQQFQRIFQARPSLPQAQIVDSYNDTVLLEEKSGNITRVIVQKAGMSSWMVLSRDDYTANHSSLSRDGKIVAYRTQKDQNVIHIVPLDSSQTLSIAQNQILDVAKQQNFQDTTICDWTDLAWSPDSQRFAFYACSPNPSRSMVMIAATQQMTASLLIVDRTPISSTQTRSLDWLTDKELIVIDPSPANDGSTEVHTYAVP